MLGAFLKKKITHKEFAKLLVKLILNATDRSFEDVAMLINEDKSFVKKPNIHPKDDGKFILIVVNGNLRYLNKQLDTQDYKEIEKAVIEELALVFDFSAEKMQSTLQEFDTFMNRVNFPSKNTLYAMSKGLFYKYNLVDYQDTYFKNMQSPNPLFIKRLDEIMEHFIIDINAYLKKFKLEQAA